MAQQQPRSQALKLHISDFPSSDVRNAREILTRSVSEGDTSQRFQSVPSLTLRVEKDRNVQLPNWRFGLRKIETWHFKLAGLRKIETWHFKTGWLRKIETWHFKLAGLRKIETWHFKTGLG